MVSARWDRQQYSVLFIVAVTSFLGTFLISSVNIALPAIEKSFNLNAIALSWVVSAFLLATAMFLLPIGRWGDLTGNRKIFKIGVILFTLSSLGSGLVQTGHWLIALRFIQGAGAAFTTTTGPAILVSAFPPNQRGRVLGISVSAVYLGLAMGPFIGGIITQQLGWRAIFYISSALGAVLALVAFKFLKKDAPRTTERNKLKLQGSLSYMIGLLCLVAGSALLPDFKGWLLMLTGVVALVAFWLFEGKSEHPVFDTYLFRSNRLFAFSNLAALINYSATFAIVFMISLYLQKVLGLSPQKAGSILVAQPIMMAAFSPLAGRLSDKFQPRYLSSIGMTLCTLGLGAFSQLSETTSLAFILIILVVVGLGFALFSSPNMNTIMSSVQKNQLGIASGAAATMRVLGQITSLSIATLFFALLFGQKAVEVVSNTVFLQALHYAFYCFTALCALGVYLSYSRGRIDR